MQKGRLKEEDVVKISINAKRTREEIEFEEVIKLVKLRAKRKRMKSN